MMLPATWQSCLLTRSAASIHTLCNRCVVRSYSDDAIAQYATLLLESTGILMPLQLLESHVIIVVCMWLRKQMKAVSRAAQSCGACSRLFSTACRVQCDSLSVRVSAS